MFHFWEQSGRPTEEVRGLSGAQTREIIDACKHKVRNWAYAVHAGLNRLGYGFQLDATTPQRIELARVLELLAKPAENIWQDLDVCPRTCRVKAPR